MGFWFGNFQDEKVVKSHLVPCSRECDPYQLGWVLIRNAGSQAHSRLRVRICISKRGRLTYSPTVSLWWDKDRAQVS